MAEDYYFRVYIEDHCAGDADCTSCDEFPEICRFCESFVHNEYIYDFEIDDGGHKKDDIVKVTMCENESCKYNSDEENTFWKDIYCEPDLGE